MISVFVADDHAVVRDGLARIFQVVEDMEFAGGAETVRETIAGCLAHSPDVLILDLSLPGGGGMEVLRHLQTHLPKLPVVVYSMYDEAQYGAVTLRNGASAYLSKSRSTNILLDAVRKVARGGRYVTDTVADSLIESPGDSSGHDKLSARELQVLQLLAEGLTTSDISTQLNLAQSTVSSHLRNIRDKLGVRARPDLIRYAFRNKLVN